MEENKFDNLFIAKLLRQMAAAHEVKGENIFTIRAYENAADSVERLSGTIYDLWEEGKLNTVPGFGKNITAYLDEYFRTGRIGHFEKLKKGLPKAMFEILGLPHIRSKTAYKLSKNLNLKPGSALEELEEHARKGQIRALPGFGEQSEKEILEGLIKAHGKTNSRMLISQAYEIAGGILKYLKGSPLVLRADPLGSLRRFVSTVGDIDISVSAKDKKEAIKYFLKFPNISEVLWSGDNKATALLKNGKQVDVMVESAASYGSLLQHFTGSKIHNIQLREFALKKGLSLSEHGIKIVKTGKNLEFGTEESFYEALGLGWIPPEMREGVGEIEASARKPLPKLVEVCDIKGDLQSHTVWSDGTNTVEEMAKAAKDKGYVYFGVTDHQQSLSSFGKADIISEIKMRKGIIEQINYSSSNFRVLNGVEILIKANGELAYPDDILTYFDYVIASIHTGFSLGKEVNTKRIIRSLKNPLVKIFGHPTGRLINQRDSVEADWTEIFKVCAGEGKILEINAFPERLDLPDFLVKEAKSLGNKFVINTDSHSPEHLDNMIYGVEVGKRGWLTKEDVVNTLPFGKLKEVLGIVD